MVQVSLADCQKRTVRDEYEVSTIGWPLLEALGIGLCVIAKLVSSVSSHVPRVKSICLRWVRTMTTVVCLCCVFMLVSLLVLQEGGYLELKKQDSFSHCKEECETIAKVRIAWERA